MYPVGMQFKLNYGPENKENYTKFHWWYDRLRDIYDNPVFTITGYTPTGEKAYTDFGPYVCQWVNPQDNKVMHEHCSSLEMIPIQFTMELAIKRLEELL